ncbi:MAG: hypothetical protein IKR30_01965 [Bacteroidales bacterium]|nr:hypothetical protein [Bacteroidales bacterium]
MGTKKTYSTPAVLRLVDYAPQGALLAGSIVKDASVTSIGQKVDTYDFEGATFNHEWEN